MTFSGPSYRTICQADGHWSHPVPRCYGQCVMCHVSYISLMVSVIELFPASCIVPDINNGKVDKLAVGARVGHDQGEQLTYDGHMVTTHCVPSGQGDM